MTSLARTCILICFAVAGTAAGNWVHRRNRQQAERNDTADAPDSLVASLQRAGSAAGGKGFVHAAFDQAAGAPDRLPAMIRELSDGGEDATAEALCLIWAQADPAGVTTWLESRTLPANLTRRLARAAFSAWAASDLDDALTAAVRSLHPAVRDPGVLAAFDRASRRNFTEACRVLQRAPDVIPPSGEGALRSVADLRTALELPASDWRDDLIARWFAARPPAEELAEALPLLDKLPALHRANAIREHVRHIAAADFASGLDALQRHLAMARGPGMAAFLLSLPWPDLESAWEWCILTLDGPDLSSAQREVLEAALAKGLDTLSGFLDALPEGPMRTGILTKVCARSEWANRTDDFAKWAEVNMTLPERYRMVPALLDQWKLSGAARNRLTERLLPPPQTDPTPEEIDPPVDPKAKKKKPRKEETGEED